MLKSLTLLRRSFSTFQKFDYTDALNFQSQLTEEEVMVLGVWFRLWKEQENLLIDNLHQEL